MTQRKKLRLGRGAAQYNGRGRTTPPPDVGTAVFELPLTPHPARGEGATLANRQGSTSPSTVANLLND